MDRRGREAIAARGFEQLRRESLVGLKGVVQIRALGDFDRQPGEFPRPAPEARIR